MAMTSVLLLLLCLYSTRCIAEDSLTFTSIPSSAAIGEPVKLTWSGGSSDPVTITLTAESSTYFSVLTTNGTGGAFTWTLDTSTPPGTYTLIITQGDATSHSGTFSIAGGSGSAAGTSTAPTPATSPTPATPPTPVTSSAPSALPSFGLTPVPSDSVGPYIPFVSGASSGPVALPGSPFTGSCSMPTYSSVSANAVVTQFAIIGCSNERPGCCVGNSGDTAAGGLPKGFATLTRCPVEYFQTNSGCCPLGWSVYSTALGSSTPCYTVPPAPFSVSMPSTLSTIAPSTSVIPDKVFTLQYVLQQPGKKGGLSNGAEAGICVGLVVFCLIPLVIALLRRRRGGTSPEPEPPLKRMSVYPTMLENGSTTHIVLESNKAKELDAAWVGELADLEEKLSGTRRGSSVQDIFLEFELKGQQPPAHFRV